MTEIFRHVENEGLKLQIEAFIYPDVPISPNGSDIIEAEQDVTDETEFFLVEEAIVLGEELDGEEGGSTEDEVSAQEIATENLRQEAIESAIAEIILSRPAEERSYWPSCSPIVDKLWESFIEIMETKYGRDVRYFVKPWAHESADLMIHWVYPPMRTTKHPKYGITTDPDNPCMTIRRTKLRQRKDLEEMSDGIFETEMVFQRFEPPENGYPFDVLPPEELEEHLKLRMAYDRLCTARVALVFGTAGSDWLDDNFAQCPKIRVSNVKLFGKPAHIVVEKSDAEINRMYFLVDHPQHHMYRMPNERAELLDVMWNAAIAISGLSMLNSGYFTWKNESHSTRRNKTRSQRLAVPASAVPVGTITAEVIPRVDSTVTSDYLVDPATFDWELDSLQYRRSFLHTVIRMRASEKESGTLVPYELLPQMLERYCMQRGTSLDTFDPQKSYPLQILQLMPKNTKTEEEKLASRERTKLRQAELQRLRRERTFIPLTQRGPSYPERRKFLRSLHTRALAGEVLDMDAETAAWYKSKGYDWDPQKRTMAARPNMVQAYEKRKAAVTEADNMSEPAKRQRRQKKKLVVAEADDASGSGEVQSRPKPRRPNGNPRRPNQKMLADSAIQKMQLRQQHIDQELAQYTAAESLGESYRSTRLLLSQEKLSVLNAARQNEGLFGIGPWRDNPLLDSATLPNVLGDIAEDDDIFALPSYIDIECSDRTVAAECHGMFLNRGTTGKKSAAAMSFLTAAEVPLTGLPQVKKFWEDAALAKICTRLFNELDKEVTTRWMANSDRDKSKKMLAPGEKPGGKKISSAILWPQFVHPGPHLRPAEASLGAPAVIESKHFGKFYVICNGKLLYGEAGAMLHNVEGSPPEDSKHLEGTYMTLARWPRPPEDSAVVELHTSSFFRSRGMGLTEEFKNRKKTAKKASASDQIANKDQEIDGGADTEVVEAEDNDLIEGADEQEVTMNDGEED